MTEVQSKENLKHVYLDISIRQLMHDVLETDRGQVLKHKTRRVTHFVHAHIEQLDDVPAT
jgi:hypothetical protein